MAAFVLSLCSKQLSANPKLFSKLIPSAIACFAANWKVFGHCYQGDFKADVVRMFAAQLRAFSGNVGSLVGWNVWGTILQMREAYDLWEDKGGAQAGMRSGEQKDMRGAIGQFFSRPKELFQGLSPSDIWKNEGLFGCAISTLSDGYYDYARVLQVLDLSLRRTLKKANTAEEAVRTAAEQGLAQAHIGVLLSAMHSNGGLSVGVLSPDSAVQTLARNFVGELWKLGAEYVQEMSRKSLAQSGVPNATLRTTEEKEGPNVDSNAEDTDCGRDAKRTLGNPPDDGPQHRSEGAVAVARPTGRTGKGSAWESSDSSSDSSSSKDSLSAPEEERGPSSSLPAKQLESLPKQAKGAVGARHTASLVQRAGKLALKPRVSRPDGEGGRQRDSRGPSHGASYSTSPGWPSDESSSS